MGEFKLKFWGVRGSYPVPGPSTMRIGGNTSCLEVNVDGQLIIIDAGTGIIKLGDALMQGFLRDHNPITATILFSHMHHDHNQGFPFFKPAYLGTSTLYFFGPKLFQEDIGEILRRAMLSPFFPVELSELSSAKIIQSIAGSEYILFRKGEQPQVINRFRSNIETSQDDVVVEVMKSYAHPSNGVFYYKIRHKGKTVVYATDTEGYLWGDQKLIDFSRNADILIHDAQYTVKQYSDPRSPKQGFGHSTPEMAIDVAKKADVKKLILFHHDPDHTDEQITNIEQASKRLFPDSQAAYEGLEIDLLT